MTVKEQYDVVIVGGSFAGLSAALLLGRSLRRVLVIDAGKPCNRQTPHSHGFLTRDGETPAQLLALARQQLEHYPTVQHWADTALSVDRQADGFNVTTAGGVQFSGRKLLLATGVEDLMPDLPGFAECWGRSVLHCPYCHGYEVHGQPLGLLGNGDLGYEMATLIQQWSPQLTLFTNGPSTLTSEQRQTLDQLRISVIETQLAAIEHEAGFLTALHLTDGSRATLKAVFARVPFRQHTDLAAQLGCLLTDTGLINAAEFGETNVPGAYAIGDATSPMRQVAAAVAHGAKAGAWINKALIADDLQRRLQPVAHA